MNRAMTDDNDNGPPTLRPGQQGVSYEEYERRKTKHLADLARAEAARLGLSMAEYLVLVGHLEVAAPDAAERLWRNAVLEGERRRLRRGG